MSTAKQRKTLLLTEDSVEELHTRNKDNHSEAARTIIRRYAFVVREGEASLKRFDPAELGSLARKFRNCQFDYPESLLFLDSIAVLTADEQRLIASMTLPERIAFVDSLEIACRKAGQA